MNFFHPPINPNRKKSIFIVNKFKLNSSLPKIKENKRKMSISPRGKRHSHISKKNNSNIHNEISIFKNKIIPNRKKSIYSIYKRSQISNLEQSSSHSKRNSCELFQLTTNKFFQRYSLGKGSGTNTNNNHIINNNNSYLNIENNLKKAINIMKNKIENEKNQKKGIKPKSRNSCSNRNLNDLKGIKKIRELISLSPMQNKIYIIRRNKTFDLTEESYKKLRKRIKDGIKEEIKNEIILKRVSDVIKSDNSEDEEKSENRKIKKHLSFSPHSNFILIFDILLIISNLYSIIVIPLDIAKNKNILEKESNLKEVIKYLNDLIYLFDFLISLVRGYFNYEMEIIRNNKGILIHYLKQDFFIDLIEGIPVFILIRLFYKNNENFYFFIFDFKLFLVKLLLFVKSFKIFKIMEKKKNKALKDLFRFLSIYYYLEKVVYFMISFIIFLLFIHLFICLHIFFDLQSYPNWISQTNVANETFIKKYITSFYFLMTTMTTVGYGDTVCISAYERIFHIILLGIGTIIYSFIVSKIGNYLRDESYEQIKLSKDLNILESIRLTYPTMSFKLYYKIKNHLLNISKKRKKTGLSLLINGIPDTIKNELLFKIYSKVINNFNIFKDINNSNFILQVLTSFIPIISKKEETLILEGEFIENIIFVKDGRLSLEISIDLNDPYKSIQNYLMTNFNGISRKKEMKNNNLFRANSILGIKSKNFRDLKTEIDNILLDKQKTVIKTDVLNDNNGISMDLGRLNFSMNKNEETIFHEGYQYIKIIDIRKNEHFGDIHIFLQRPSPFTLTVKSRLAEILLLRKQDAIMISESFPNIWRRIYNNSYHNLVSIKELIYKILNRYYNTYYYNKDKKIVNMSKLDITTNSRLSRKSSGKSEISKIIRKTKTIARDNSKIIKTKNPIEKVDKNKLDCKLHRLKKNSEEIGKEISFSESFQTLKLTNSIKNIINETNQIESNSSSNSNEYNSNNNEIAKIALKKFTFKKESTINQLKNINKDILDRNKKARFSKGTNNINTSNSIYSINNSHTLNNKSIHDIDSNTEKISKQSKNKNEFLILEDINTNFAKKIKNKIKKRKKIEKIRSLFELQKQKYKKSLNEICSQINNQNQNQNLITNQNDCPANLYNTVIYNNQKKLTNISCSTSNNLLFSQIIDSEEEKSNFSNQNNSKFNLQSLKKITSESFEIKSSYENINILSKGEIINNMKYKYLLQLILKKFMNKWKFNENSIKEIISEISNYNKVKEMSEKKKNNLYYYKRKTEKTQKQSKNLLFEKNKTLIIPKSKKLTLNEENNSSNHKWSFNKKITKTSNISSNNNTNENQYQKKKSKFHIPIEKLEITKHNSCKQNNIKNISENNVLEKEDYLSRKKANKKDSIYKKTKTEGKRIYNNIRILELTKKEKNKENENNIILTSSANVINEIENENIFKNKLEIFDKKSNNQSLTKKMQNNNENNNNCIII